MTSSDEKAELIKLWVSEHFPNAHFSKHEIPSGVGYCLIDEDLPNRLAICEIDFNRCSVGEASHTDWFFIGTHGPVKYQVHISDPTYFTKLCTTLIEAGLTHK